jgi:hypothetical protein
MRRAVVLFHRFRAAAWVVVTAAAAKWWPDSVLYVIIASGYANAVSDWAAAEAADDRTILRELEELRALIERQG